MTTEALRGLLATEPAVAAAGVSLFADALRSQAVNVTETVWKPPLDGTQDDLYTVLADSRRVDANSQAFSRMVAATAGSVASSPLRASVVMSGVLSGQEREGMPGRPSVGQEDCGAGGVQRGGAVL